MSCRYPPGTVTQVDDLIATMEKILPAGPPFFPEDTLTDVSERFIVAELVREQVFRMTGEEIPYATAVTVDTFKEKKGGRLISIEATIHLERSSQKGIVIGKNGAKLKQIGTRSREQIERLLGTKVFLKLFVRIQKKLSQRYQGHPKIRLLNDGVLEILDSDSVDKSCHSLSFF